MTLVRSAHGDVSINRNIVECKAITHNVINCLFGINRNIVECKGILLDRKSVHNRVLIETLWNVKEETQPGMDERVSVLIETLWNVKIVPLLPFLSVRPVLIETLWNVKHFAFYDYKNQRPY